MTQIDTLLSLGSGALAAKPAAMPELLRHYALGPELFAMLEKKNGFYAFESALHVFPVSPDPIAGLEDWNSVPLWRNLYGDLAVGLLFFAEDVFQDQFCITSDGISRFKAETGATVLMADSVEGWARAILSDNEYETGYTTAHAWQAGNGPLSPGKRLMPKIPFFLGGDYSLENLWAGDSVEGMLHKGNVAQQTRSLPDGTQVRLRPVKPN